MRFVSVFVLGAFLLASQAGLGSGIYAAINAISAHAYAATDTTPPTDPGSVTITRVGTSTPAVFKATWGASTDDTSLAGYSYLFDQAEGTIPDATVDTTGTEAISGPLNDGVWAFHVLAVDSAGNVSSTTHSVDFRVDTVKPVITLIGDANMTVNQGDTFTDPGSNAIDNVDGTLRATVTGTVDTSTPGTYTLTYNVSDSSGNAADPVTRTVTVVSNSSTATSTTSTSTPDTTAPSAPTNVNVTGQGSAVPSTVTATWDASTDNVGVAGYSFAFTQDPFATAADNTIDTTSTSLSQDLGQGTWYFQVKAIDAAGNASAVSQFGPITVGPNGGPTPCTSNCGGGPTPTDNTPPTAPTGVTVSRVGTTTPAVFQATWNASTDNVGVAGYSVSFDQDASATPDNTIDTTDTTMSSSTLSDGVWVVHVKALDAAGNASDVAASADFRVDNVKPVITLIGPADMTVNVGDTFTDPGSNAIDNVDGTLRAIVTGTVDTSTPGTYVLSYNVSDAAGNAADTVTRTVHVVSGGGTGTTTDTTAPVGPTAITSSSHQVNVPSSNTTVLLSWDAATDNVGVAGYSYVVDQNANTVPDNTVDTTVTNLAVPLTNGTYYIHVASVDTSGNISTPVTFGPVIIDTNAGNGGSGSSTDTTAPTAPGTITWQRVGTSTPATIRFSWVPSTDNVGVAGYSYVIDWADGTVPDTVIDTASPTVDATLDDAAYVIHVRAIDAAGNASPVTSLDFRVDTVPPVVTLLGNADMSVSQGSTFTDPGVTVNDNIDGSIDHNVNVTGSVDTNTVGDYTLTYVGYDAAGNLSAPVTRTVHVVSGPVPDQNNPSTPSGFTATRIGTTLPAHMRITWNPSTDNAGIAGYSYVLDQENGTTVDGTVDTSSTSIETDLADGGYNLHIRAVDNSGNLSPVAVFNFRVDTVPPVVTLLGSQVMTVEQGSTFTDPGVTVTDNVDGSIDRNVNVTGQVDTNTPGTYTLTYVGYDAAGNLSAPVTRTVIVSSTGGTGGGGNGNVDTTPPVGPTTVTSDTHQVNTTSTSSLVNVMWNAATDNVGVAGYSFVWDHNANTVPNNIVDTSFTSASTALPDGTWYFHVVSVDTSGNISSPVANFGPITINTSSTSTGGNGGSTSGSGNGGNTGGSGTTTATLNAPTGLTLHRIGSGFPGVIQATWNPSTSNVSGYSYSVNMFPTFTPDNLVETSGTASTNFTLPDGIWYFHLKAVDGQGNFSPTVDSSIRIDTTAPTITLLGSPVVYVEAGAPYTDLGAVAMDNLDGVITNNIVTTGTVNTGVVGDYTITYNVMDGSGNHATPVTRTVHVVPSSSVPFNFSINATAGTNGTISPNGNISAAMGSNQTFVITPNAGYSIATLTVDGINQPVSGSYTFTNVQGNHSISATFATSSGTTSGTPSGYIPPIAFFRTSVNALDVMAIDETLNQNGSAFASSSYSYAWNFGDGTTAHASTTGLGNNQTHSYAHAGTYPVTLVLTDTYGNVSTSTQYVTVFEPSIGTGGITSGGGYFVFNPITIPTVPPIPITPFITETTATSGIQITGIQFAPNLGQAIKQAVNLQKSRLINTRAAIKVATHSAAARNPMKTLITLPAASASQVSNNTAVTLTPAQDNNAATQNSVVTTNASVNVKQINQSIFTRIKTFMQSLFGY